MKRFGTLFFCIFLLAVTALGSSMPTPTPSATAREKTAAAKELVDRGLVLLNKKDYEGAFGLFNQALANDPDYLDAYRFRAVTALQIYELNPPMQGQRLYTALFNLDHAIKRGSTNPDDFYLRGQTNEYLNKKAEALADYRRALSIDANHRKAKDAITRMNAPLAGPKPSPSPVSNSDPKGVLSLDSLIGLWEGTSVNGTTTNLNSFRFSRIDGRTEAKWYLNEHTFRMLPENISFLPSRMVSLKYAGDGVAITFLGTIDQSGNKISGTFIMTADGRKATGTWAVIRNTPGTAGSASASTPASSSDDARFKQILLDLAVGKPVPEADISWANRYEQQKKADRKPSTGTTSSPAVLTNVIFYDDFVDNKAGWNLENAGDHSYVITPSGQLVMEGRGGFGYTVQLPHARAVKIDQNKDFSIETSFTQVSGYLEYPVGILWGRKDGTSGFYFGIYGTGRYNYGRSTPSGWNEIVNGTSDAVNKGMNVKNKIAIRKRGSVLEFYINDKRVNSTPYVIYTEPMPTVGVTFNFPKVVAFDYIKILQ